MKKIFVLMVILLFFSILSSCTKEDTTVEASVITSTKTQTPTQAQTQATAQTSETLTPIQNIKVTANGLNIRQDRSTNSEILSKVYKNDVFGLLEEARMPRVRFGIKLRLILVSQAGWQAGIVRKQARMLIENIRVNQVNYWMQ